jgi:hypothetical protein
MPPWERLPSAARHFDLEKEVDPNVMRRVNERLGEELDSGTPKGLRN